MQSGVCGLCVQGRQYEILWRVVFSSLFLGMVELKRILMGVLDWQLERFSSPKYSSLPPAFPKDAGTSTLCVISFRPLITAPVLLSLPHKKMRNALYANSRSSHCSVDQYLFERFVHTLIC